jgi:hypothetical protein
LGSRFASNNKFLLFKSDSAVKIEIMKYVIRHVPYGWKTTSIVVQKAKSHYLSEPVMRLGLITKHYGYRYVQVDLNMLGFCLYHGVRYESREATNKAMDMMINKWELDTKILLKRKDSKII